MANYYINYKIDEEQIIDEQTLEEENYINADDFMFLCEAETLEEAQQKHRNDCALASIEAKSHR